jgi:hypothetical protein
MPDLLERLKSALADRYAVESEIGRGGMAVVFLAEDLRHDRRVAIRRVLLDLCQRRRWWPSMSNGYVHISALLLVQAALHFLDESGIAEKDLTCQIQLRRGRFNAFGHQLCIACARHRTPLGKLHSQAIDRQKGLHRCQAHVRAVAAPQPLARPLDHACPHRIQHDVTGKLQKVRNTVDLDRLETPLDQVTHLAE